MSPKKHQCVNSRYMGTATTEGTYERSGAQADIGGLSRFAHGSFMRVRRYIISTLWNRSSFGA